jgi:alanyl-tRNA synthetase
MAETAAVVIDTMAEAYPHLEERRTEILGAIAREEAQFVRTLEAGTDILEEALIPLTSNERVVGQRPEDLPAGAPQLSGEVAFKLHDTFGFPIDLTVELAAEYGVGVDREGFERALAEQRERSRSGKKAELARHAELVSLYQSIQGRSGDSEFLGYETTTVPGARVVAILRDDVEYETLEAKGDEELRTEASAAAEVVLDRTPFYGEGGGQVGDRGVLRDSGGVVVFEVEDTQKPVGGLFVHRGKLRGRLAVGETIAAEVDADRRAHTMRNHTGTHLLHRALRNVVGDRARQAGSLVTPDYLRFDYPFERALTDDERRAIEDEVRRIIRDDRPVSIAFMGMQQAIDAGADAFFDEKYGETVRTIRVEDYSFELCGGTHCRASGQIGGFVITSDRSIGSGMRRIEALTGAGADASLRASSETLEAAMTALGAQTVEAIPQRIAALRDQAKRRGGMTVRGIVGPSTVAERAVEIAPGVQFVQYVGPYESIDTLKAAAKEVRGILGSGVIAMALEDDEPQFFVSVSDDLAARGIAAGDLVKAAMPGIDGKGGGRPEMAQGRGTRREGLAEAMAALETAAREAAGRGG